MTEEETQDQTIPTPDDNFEQLKQQVQDYVPPEELDKSDDGMMPRSRYNDVNEKYQEAKARASRLERQLEEAKTQYQKDIDKKALSEGDFKSVIKSKDREISNLNSTIAELKKQYKCLQIGIEVGLPTKFARLLAGAVDSDNDEVIKNQAEELFNVMGKASGRVDASRSSSAQGGGQQTPQFKVLDGAF